MLVPPLNIDSFVLQRLKAGDEFCYQEIFEYFYPKITGFCMVFLKDRDKSKSIAQEAFIKLWVQRETIQKPTGITAFLYTAAKSECLNFLRHQRVVRHYRDSSLSGRENKLQIEVLEDIDTDEETLNNFRKDLEKAIAQLPKKSRLVFTMARIQNKKTIEISKELGITPKAVEANMTRALKKLRESLSKYKSTIFFLHFLEF